MEELFEVRPVKRKAILAHHDGIAEITSENNQKKVTIKYIDKDSKKQNKEDYDVSGYAVWVKHGAKVKIGQQLTDGSMDLHELYEVRGKKEVEKYILREIQYIYSSQGQKLNDKHIETIIRQMFSRYEVIESGDTDLLPGEIVPKSYFFEANDKIKNEKGTVLAKGKELLLGITRVSLSTDSWLAAASFQETSRVLVNAAISGRVDYLRGLKENVIVGRLIPAGTGLEKNSKP